jgi:hypothetical protein
MSCVLYNVETTKLVPAKGYYNFNYKTAAAAKAARTRNGLDKNLYSVAEAEYFYSNIEKKETRINLMSRKEFVVGVNSPYSTCPSSETYWSS